MMCPYLIAIDIDDNTRCGSGFQQACHHKYIFDLAKDAILMQKANPSIIKNIYFIKDFSQKLCEISPKEFTKYVKTYGIKLL